jgi:SAM-dependent methyltransferase
MSQTFDSIFRFNRTGRDAWVARQAAQIKAGSRVLDVGAGRGPYRTLFGHCEYRAHDFGEEPATLGEYTPLDYESDICAIPVPDESFDVILCTEVLEHVPEPIAAVRELARILVPGGRLLLSAPLGSNLHQEPYHFYGGYTPYWYELYFGEFGLDLESVEANGGFFRMFGQEAMRFSVLIDPRRIKGNAMERLVLGLFWAATLPIFRGVLPLAGPWLDRLGLERAHTVGYHVVGIKRWTRHAE